jgi:uncharacterized protein
MTSHAVQSLAHLHDFSLGGHAYLVNSTTGQAFAVAPVGAPAAGFAVPLKDLQRFGHLDVVDEAQGDIDAPPTGIGSVLFNVTHRCNLACDYCVMAMPDLQHAYHDEKQSMTKETGKACIDLLAKVGYRDIVSLTFFGGEPLLKFDLIRAIVEYAEAKYPGRFNYQLITNGCLMQPKMYDFFRRHEFSFLWSLDGEPEVHDRLRHFKKAGGGSVFAQSFAALKALKAAWPECRVGVNITYFRQTIELPAALAFFRSQGVDSIRMDRGLVPRESAHAVGMEEVVRVKAQLSQVAEDYLGMLLAGDVFSLDPFVNYMRVIAKRLPRHRSCNSGLDYITVSATGEIYSCYKLLGVADCKMGDVRSGFSQDTSRELWERLDATTRPGCSKCWARFICAGGCAADNRHLNQSYFAPARENCAIFLHAIELSVHLYFTLLEKAPEALKTLLDDETLLDEERPQRREEILRRESHGRVENIETGGSYELNDPAELVLSLCDGAHSLKEIASALAGRYGLPPALASLDAREQLFRMAKTGLVAIPSRQ